MGALERKNSEPDGGAWSLPVSRTSSAGCAVEPQQRPWRWGLWALAVAAAAYLLLAAPRLPPRPPLGAGAGARAAATAAAAAAPAAPAELRVLPAPGSPLEAAGLCGGFTHLTARYARRSLTPLLEVYRCAGGPCPAYRGADGGLLAGANATGPPGEPCALVKLSCRLRLSPDEGAAVTVRHRGTGQDQVALLDTAWGDALSGAALAALAPPGGAPPYAGVLAPGGGVRVEGWRAADARVPATCVWPGDALLGYAVAFVPALRKQVPTRARLEAQSDAGVAALAAIWTMDALMGSTDRQGRKNMFVAAPAGGGSRGGPPPDGADFVALDFNDWQLGECAPLGGGGERAALARLPNFVRHLVAGDARAGASACDERGALRPGRAALAAAARACGAAPGARAAERFAFSAAACDGFRARLRTALLADTWFGAEAAAPATFRAGTQCCAYDAPPTNGQPVVSRCGACCEGQPAAARRLCQAIQAHVAPGCFDAHLGAEGGETAAGFLAALVAARLADFGSRLQSTLRECA